MPLSDLSAEDILAIIRMVREDNPIIRSKALITGNDDMKKEKED